MLPLSSSRPSPASKPLPTPTHTRSAMMKSGSRSVVSVVSSTSGATHVAVAAALIAQRVVALPDLLAVAALAAVVGEAVAMSLLAVVEPLRPRSFGPGSGLSSGSLSTSRHGTVSVCTLFYPKYPLSNMFDLCLPYHLGRLHTTQDQLDLRCSSMQHFHTFLVFHIYTFIPHSSVTSRLSRLACSLNVAMPKSHF